MGAINIPNSKPSIPSLQIPPDIKVQPPLNKPSESKQPSTPVDNKGNTFTLTLKEKLLIIGIVIIIALVPTAIGIGLTSHYYHSRNNLIKIEQSLEKTPVDHIELYNNLTLKIKNSDIISSQDLKTLETLVDQDIAYYQKELEKLTNNPVYIATIKKTIELDKKLNAYNVHKNNIIIFKNKQQELQSIIKSIQDNISNIK